ncbi:MAG: hypothetical protein PHO48_02280 [Candidatus Gracilibacteria bacterium]|nr:hypothetical protein [Candidatus Gracilibacteria bacterium]MDD5179181.1 hypothetical protein [Candidatus Gracilibacteria bacterium]
MVYPIRKVEEGHCRDDRLAEAIETYLNAVTGSFRIISITPITDSTNTNPPQTYTQGVIVTIEYLLEGSGQISGAVSGSTSCLSYRAFSLCSFFEIKTHSKIINIVILSSLFLQHFFYS